MTDTASAIVAAATAGIGALIVGWAVGRGRSAEVRSRLGRTPSSSASSLPVPATLGRCLAELGLEPRVWGGRALLGGAVVVAVLGLTAGPVVGAAVAATLLAAPRPAIRLLTGRAARRAVASLPDAMDATARSLRSGASLRLALADAAGRVPPPLGDDLATVAADADAGLGFDGALDRWGARRDTPEVRWAVAALSLAAEAGGAQAAPVEGLAQSLRDQVAARAEARAWAAQAQLSALVIGLAPVAFMVFTTSTDARVAHFLFRTPAGGLVLVAGLALDVAAAVWMRRLARVEV